MSTMKAEKNPISDKQMASMHIVYREFAKLLNEAGYDIKRAVMEEKIRIPIPFTEENVKQIFGYAVLESLFPEKFEDPKKPKHPRLTTTETLLAFETLNNAMSVVFGVSMPFPEKPKDE